MVGVGRDLCGSPSPTLLPKQGHPEQAAQDVVQAGLEYLQRGSVSRQAQRCHLSLAPGRKRPLGAESHPVLFGTGSLSPSPSLFPAVLFGAKLLLGQTAVTTPRVWVSHRYDRAVPEQPVTSWLHSSNSSSSPCKMNPAFSP